MLALMLLAPYMQVKKVHWLVSLAENKIQTGDELMFFTKVNQPSQDPYWYYAPTLVSGDTIPGNYPDIKVVRCVATSSHICIVLHALPAHVWLQSWFSNSFV